MSSTFPDPHGRNQSGSYNKNIVGTASSGTTTGTSTGGGWKYQHPLVSTLLWILGSQQDVLERSHSDGGSSHGAMGGQGGSGTGSSPHRLHWKDEHDGQIAEVFEPAADDADTPSPSSAQSNDISPSTNDAHQTATSQQAPSVSSSSSSSPGSGAAVPGGSPAPMRRNISSPFSNLVPSHDMLPSDADFHPEEDEDLSESPQWGWYVSTTPPQQQQYSRNVAPPAPVSAYSNGGAPSSSSYRPPYNSHIPQHHTIVSNGRR